MVTFLIKTFNSLGQISIGSQAQYICMFDYPILQNKVNLINKLRDQVVILWDNQNQKDYNILVYPSVLIRE